MIGDKLVIEQHHTERAQEVCDLVEDRLTDTFVVTVAGESGSGKSELAAEIARELTDRGRATDMLQQDDYFVFPPQTNHEMRRKNLDQVGPYEVKLDFMDANLRSFKRSESPIYKPLVVYDDDRITREEKDTSTLVALVAEGTYTSLLEFADFRVFIDRDYHQTKATREQRARDVLEPFIQDVLEREHRIISQHKSRADAVIASDFGRVETPS
ncbi:MAG: uridine kinase [Candidatus Bipolaricaulia bacterium]